MVLKQSEREFQAQLIKVVEMLGGLVYHTYDSRRSAKGYPDLTILTLDRRVIFAELKNDRGRLTEDQRVWLEALPDHQAYLWRPDDFDDAVRIIQKGHRVSEGVIQNADGANFQPLRVIQREATCIACKTP